MALKQFCIKNVGPSKIQRVQQKIPGCWTYVQQNENKFQKVCYILDKESKRKKLNTPVKENFCKNLFQTPKSNQNEGNDFENDDIQMEVCCPPGKEIPQCNSESIEINDMIDLLPKALKSLEDVGQRIILKIYGTISIRNISIT